MSNASTATDTELQRTLEIVLRALSAQADEQRGRIAQIESEKKFFTNDHPVAVERRKSLDDLIARRQTDLDATLETLGNVRRWATAVEGAVNNPGHGFIVGHRTGGVSERALGAIWGDAGRLLTTRKETSV